MIINSLLKQYFKCKTSSQIKVKLKNGNSNNIIKNCSKNNETNYTNINRTERSLSNRTERGLSNNWEEFWNPQVISTVQILNDLKI